MISDFVKLSVRNLKRRGKRSWLTIIGVVIGITAIVTLFSLAQGFEDSITREFEDLGANTIYVIPGSGASGFFGAQAEGELKETDLEAVKRAKGVEQAGPIIFAQTDAEYQRETKRVPLLGIPTDESQEMIMRTNSLKVDKGRKIVSTDRRSALSGYRLVQAEIFETEVGLRDQIKVEGENIRIVGTLERSGDPEYDRSLVMPIESVREILGDQDRIDFVIAQVQEGQEPRKVADRIEQELRDERNLSIGEEDFTVSTAEDLLESFLSILNLVQFVVIGIVSIALLVGGLGIMNTMYMSVSERTKEIGIMKAVGATKKQILSIYLFESGVLGFIGGVIGILLGLVLTEISFYIVRQFSGIPLQSSISLNLIISALMLSFVLGSVSGFLPARKAAKLQPVEAIREE